MGQYGINLHVTKKAPTHAVVFCFPFGDLFNKMELQHVFQNGENLMIVQPPHKQRWEVII